MIRGSHIDPGSRYVLMSDRTDAFPQNRVSPFFLSLQFKFHQFHACITFVLSWDFKLTEIIFLGNILHFLETLVTHATVPVQWVLCSDKIKIIRITLWGPCKISCMKIRLSDASFLHGEVKLTCFLVCDCVFEITCMRWEQMKETGPEWGVTNTNRQNNYPFPHGAVSVSVTATLSQWSSWIAVTLSKGREGSAWSAVTAPWADDAGCLPDFPLCWLVNYVTGVWDQTPTRLTCPH